MAEPTTGILPEGRFTAPNGFNLGPVLLHSGMPFSFIGAENVDDLGTLPTDEYFGGAEGYTVQVEEGYMWYETSIEVEGYATVTLKFLKADLSVVSIEGLEEDEKFLAILGPNVSPSDSA